MKNQVKNRIAILRERIRELAKAYYEDDTPLVSDQEYDALFKELETLEAAHPELITADSPTQKVGGQTSGRFTKVKHQTPMLSLANTFDEAGLRNFDKQIKTRLNDQHELHYVTELKIDGLSISLIYEGGKFKKAITRGDGEIGEDVTANAKMIQSLPKTISDHRSIEIRGEVYMKRSTLARHNANGENLANARNAAAGTLRQLDPQIVKNRNLDIYLYAMPNPLELGLKTHQEVLAFLKKEHFPTNEHTKIVVGIEQLIKTVESYKTLRETLDYDTDGVVIKVNDLRKWDEIGFTVKAPKFMIAYKFPEARVEAELLAIFPTVGRTGRITYNAKLSPVILAGSTVTAATLHNAEYVQSLSINVGDRVIVKKAGEVIPKVLGLAKKVNTAPWVPSTNCPICDSYLARADGEVDQYCLNAKCPGRKIAAFEHFVSRNAMNIDALSTQTLKLLISKNLITELWDIFDLPAHEATLKELPKFGEKSVQNLLAAIAKAKTPTLGKFLFALGIRHLGEKLAETLARRTGSLAALMQVQESDLSQIRDFGDAVITSVLDFINSDAGQEVVRELTKRGVSPISEAAPQSQKLAGLTFVITGTLSTSRETIKSLLESHGANISSQVSKNTNFLLAGSEAGSKLDRAQSLKVKIINEKDLEDMLK